MIVRNKNTKTQCPACRYTKATKTEYVDEALVYKSGKNKGKFKGIEIKEITLEIGHEDFKTYTIRNVDDHNGGHASCCGKSDHTNDLTFAVCPECNTMIMKPHW